MGLANCQSSLHDVTILMITTTSTGTWLFQFSVILFELQLDICREDFVFNLSGKIGTTKTGTSSPEVPEHAHYHLN